MADILAIKGSARRNGNSDRLLHKAQESLQKKHGELSMETLIAREEDITPCRSCHGCWNTGQCVINDRMQEVYQKCIDAHHVIVSAPIYFTSLPGHLKVMIDRFQCFWVRTYKLEDPPAPKRNGMFLCVGAMNDERFFNSASLIIKIWMSTLNMKLRTTRFYTGLDAKDDLDKHPDYFRDTSEAASEFSSFF